jgi:beta-phosphoglucomutase
MWGRHAVCQRVSWSADKMSAPRMPKLAVIFDLDGVLVDSYRAHFVSWTRLYSELGVQYGEAAFAADFGRTSRDILRRTLGEQLSDERIRALDERKESLFRDELRTNFPPMDGGVELIEALADDGFLLAVGSSGPPENISLCLEKLGRRGKFTAIVTGKDVTRGKPDPQVFELAARRLDVPPSECAVVEDAVHGVEAAKRAGMVSVGLTGTVERAALAAADLVVDSLRELSPERLRTLLNGRKL